MNAAETGSGDDSILPFQVGESAVRGRVIRLGAAIDDILGAHDFAPAVSEIVGEAAALVALMGASLKFDGKLIFQAQGDGPAPVIVADYHSRGELRATATLSGEALGDRRGVALVGAGHIALTIDQGPDMERYQGVTPIEGGDLSAAAVAYFERSEQIPTAVKLAVGRVQRPGESPRWRAGGVLAQFVPGEGGGRERGEAALKGPEDRDLWTRAATLLETTQADELLDPSVSAETLLYRLYHEDGVRVFDSKPVAARCGCNESKIAAVLERYGAEALEEMVEDGRITVNCEFCRRAYVFDRNGAPVKRA